MLQNVHAMDNVQGFNNKYKYHNSFNKVTQEFKNHAWKNFAIIMPRYSSFPHAKTRNMDKIKRSSDTKNLLIDALGFYLATLKEKDRIQEKKRTSNK